MKENFKKLRKFLLLLVLVSSCQDDDKSFGDINAPTGLVTSYEIVGKDDANPNGNGSGQVVLHAKADGAMTYKFVYPDGSSDANGQGLITKRFSENGVHSYTVAVLATGKGGATTTGSIYIEDLLSIFNDPVTTQLLTNNSSKVWYWAQSEQGHLGVGPNTPTGNNYWPEWYSAQPNEKAASETSSCLYDNKLTFTLQNDLIKFSLDNGGKTFFNKDFTYLVEAQNEDYCLPYDTTGDHTVILGPAESFVPEQFTTGIQMKFTNNGFMGYYIGADTYEILEITETRMVVRAVMGGNDGLAWYHTFTTVDPNGTPDPQYNTLFWSDEFDTGTSPDPSKWNFEYGNGTNGWGNQEKQYYKAENAVVEGGSLKIIAKKEEVTGVPGGPFHYTSARIQTHNKFDFTYGRVEIKAKLTSGAGTWPALWMLGSNYATNSWPACGEIDMMEYAPSLGENLMHGTLHYPGNFGGSANSTTTNIDNPTDWHVYTLIWSPNSITWSIDGAPAYKTFINGPQHPYFNWDYFLIFNVAMGGNMGGNIDPNFVQSSMEVDYVRVYQ